MQACFNDLQQTWAKANSRRQGFKFGIAVDPSRRPLTELRFADDVIMVAQQRADIIKMLRHLGHCSGKFGLRINFAKTKVLTWNTLAAGSTSVCVDGQSVEILDEAASEKYLGRKLSFNDTHETELANPIAAGWAAFHKNKSELCSKFTSLRTV